MTQPKKHCPYPLCGKPMEECPCPRNHHFGVDCDGYPWHDPNFVAAAKKAVEARKEDAEIADAFMEAMEREMSKKAKSK